MAMFLKTRPRVLAWLSRRYAGRALHEWAWSEFDRDYKRPIRQLCLFVHLSESDVDDILQRVRIKVWEKIDTFEGRSKFRTWLSSLTKRVVYDHFHKQTTESERLERFAEGLSANPPSVDWTSEVADRHDRPIDVFRAITHLERLASQFRSRGTLEAYFLHVILEFSLEETTQALASMGFDMETAGVCMAVERVNKKLRP